MNEGIVFPTQGENGKVSTTETGKKILAASIAPFSLACSKSILSERNWRANYVDRFIDYVAAAGSSDESAIGSAQEGLKYVYDIFSYEKDGKKVPLKMIKSLVPEKPVFGTRSIIGKEYDTSSFLPSIMVQNKLLYGEDVKKFTNRLVAKDYIEESAAIKAQWVVKNEEAIQKGLENTIFVVFGAGAALGPFQHLLRLGKVTVAAIDLPIPSIWNKLENLISNSKAKVHIPVHDGIKGCDLIRQVPEIIKWLSDLEPGKRLVIGNYAYADSANFIRVSLAMDAICAAVAEVRGQHEVGISYLCSPTDVFTVTDDIRNCSQLKYNSLSVGSLFHPWLSAISGSRFLIPNYESSKNVVDCVVTQQGPNYLIAKRIQHWRAIVMREQGYLVSTNIAPASKTESVTKNKLLSAAYDGSAFFDVKIFNPATANSLMTLLLFHDIFNAAASQHLMNPFDLFVDGCCHGGMWRIPYKVRSVTEIAAVLFFANEYKGPALFLSGLLYGATRASRVSKL